MYLDGRFVALNGSQTTTPSTTKTYYLVAVNGWNRVTRTAIVTVSTSAPPAPTVPTATLTAMPASIQSGQQTTLTWRTTDATSVTMNGSPVALSGSPAYSPQTTTTYTLVASNAAGSATAIATVTVSAAPPALPMPTATLTATPASIQNGQQTTLTWVTANAASVTLNGTVVAANGSHVDFPTATTTYTLVASNATGSTTATATVTVTMPPPLPTASLTATPASILTGESSTLSWTTSNAPTVTLNGAPVPSAGTLVVTDADGDLHTPGQQ